MELKNVAHTRLLLYYMTLNIMMIAVKCIFVKDHHHHHYQQQQQQEDKTSDVYIQNIK